ncbi:transcription factor bHLH68-like isoform X2 [Impatiens glandulifera]|uniref:transcription factor bHLH68-like isoform X2 n=1 Tax=Impatiens glandulifera TaxID=253017 RepID=UPI001FB10E53|nr:transcription factor bHLH68-like isoform X2 [Impatiens glandulifera]
MNRGVLQSPPAAVQQTMVSGGNPSYWWNNTNNMIMTRPNPPSNTTTTTSLLPQLPSSSFFPAHFLHAPPPPPSTTVSSSSSSSTSTWHGEYNFNQELQSAESWSQLLMDGIMGEHEEDKCESELGKKLENWEKHHHHVLNQAEDHNHHHHHLPLVKEIKQEKLGNYNNSVYGHGAGAGSVVHHHHDHDQFQQPAAANNNWSMQMMSPKSNCVSNSLISNINNNMLNFSTNKLAIDFPKHPPPDRSSECNSSTTGTGTGGAVKKARVQPCTTQGQATFKVRKEKLGDRITTLHQIVSPFGKTDTASVLLEAIGYIRFLQSQVEALSLPYLGGGAGNISHQQPVQGERNCLFPDDPGQLLNDHCIKRKGTSDHHQDCHDEEQKKDLRSRGLCLVPISCTMQVETSINGADYWTPAIGGGFR